MTHPAASIVIPSRGGAARLPMLLQALTAQTMSDFETICVLDGDIDGSEQVVAAAAPEGLPVHTIVFPENRGRAAALNAGFGAAQGQVLIRCDDDLLPGPDYVAAHVARHSGAEPVGVVGLYRNVYRPSAYARAYGRERDRRFRDDAYRASPDARWRFWAGNVSVNRETYDAVGDYDLAYRAYGWEDVDWGYRLAQAGVPIVLAPELETTHTGAAPTTEIRVDKAFHAGAARATFISKHGSFMFPDVADGEGWWARLVAAVGARADRGRLVILGKLADRTVDYLPKYVAEKVISLLVESASHSGRSHSDQTTTAL